jgi:hypothetical protein
MLTLEKRRVRLEQVLSVVQIQHGIPALLLWGPEAALIWRSPSAPVPGRQKDDDVAIVGKKVRVKTLVLSEAGGRTRGHQALSV